MALVAMDQASDTRAAALAWVARTIEAAAIQSFRLSEYLFASMLSPDEKTSLHFGPALHPRAVKFGERP